MRYIKVPPTTYLLQYRRGQLVREGPGLAVLFYAPTTTLVAVPLASTDVPFMFEERTADFQTVTIQGQVTYRVANAKRLAELMNYTLACNGTTYLSQDPTKLPQRVLHSVNVLVRAQLQALPLRRAINASEGMVTAVQTGLAQSPELGALGLQILGLSILAIRPSPETARALEAEAREQLLREADEAVYARRNAAVEQERAIKESELKTEIAIENKKRQIRETQMDAERAVLEKQHLLQQADMTAQVELEARRQELVGIATRNARAEADARAYGISATMQALAATDPRVIQALASTGMKPEQLIAAAFQDLAGKAERIGQLNVSPDLLRELLDKKGSR
jgi:hypothetical protein